MTQAALVMGFVLSILPLQPFPRGTPSLGSHDRPKPLEAESAWERIDAPEGPAIRRLSQGTPILFDAPPRISGSTMLR